jgi:hypothetical protein
MARTEAGSPNLAIFTDLVPPTSAGGDDDRAAGEVEVDAQTWRPAQRPQQRRDPYSAGSIHPRHIDRYRTEGAAVPAGRLR